MASNVGYSNLYLQMPEGLIFEGTTDDQGRLVLSFSKKELLLGSDYKIGVESFSIDTSTMHIIFSDQYLMMFKKPVTAEVRKYLPNGRIATCVELLRHIETLNVGFNRDFLHPHAHTMDLKEGKWSLPARLARALSIATVEYKVNPLVMRLNPDFTFTEEKLTIGSVSVDCIGIKADSSTKFHFPMIYLKNIWNIVSEHSFQSLYF